MNSPDKTNEHNLISRENQNPNTQISISYPVVDLSSSNDHTTLTSNNNITNGNHIHENLSHNITIISNSNTNNGNQMTKNRIVNNNNNNTLSGVDVQKQLDALRSLKELSDNRV